MLDVNLRHPETIAGAKPENYIAGLTVSSVITLTGCPAAAVPCGFDQFGRPVGLQLVGRPRGEAALLQAAALYETPGRAAKTAAGRFPSGHGAAVGTVTGDWRSPSQDRYLLRTAIQFSVVSQGVV